MLYVSLLVEALRARPVLMFWIAALSQTIVWVLVPALVITAFTLPTLDFGPSVLAMPLVALTLLHCWRAIGEERPRAWFAVGIDLGLLVLTTYAGLILVALVALFVALTARGRASLGTIGP